MSNTSAMTLAEHLGDLRKRLVRSSLAILLMTVAVWSHYPSIFAALRKPFDEMAKTHSQAILALTGVTSGFSLQLKVALTAGLVLSAPIWLYQLWQFIAPGLHAREKKWTYLFLTVAVPLFSAGIWLAYTVLPSMLGVLYEFTPSDVSNVTSVDTYLSFVIHLTLFFGFGLVIPALVLFLNFAGVISSAHIAKAWRWIVLGSFVFGAVATPSGDPVGMTVIAIPLIALMLVTYLVARVSDRRRSSRTASYATDQWRDTEASPLDTPE